MYPKLYNSGGVSYWRLCDDQFLRTTTSFVRYMRCLSSQLVPGLYLCILLFSPPLRVDRKSNVFLFVVRRVFQWGKNVRPVCLSLSHLNYTFTMQFSCIINAYANWSLAGLFSVTGPEMRLKEERITHDILVWNSQVLPFEIVDIWLSSREWWRCNSIPGSCSGEWVVGYTSEIIKCATFIRS